MSVKKPQVLQTLGDIMAAMAPYAGGAIPAETDEQYDNWIRWIQLGQQDMANRGFWRRLLVPEVITITKDVDNITLPLSLAKINAIYVLNVQGEDWAQPNGDAGQKLYVYMDPDTAEWKCKFLGFTPTETVADAQLWYYYNPPVPTALEDKVWLDGETIMFYALKEYFRKARQPGSLDDARIEYENRREELLNLEVIPSQQEIMSWSSYSKLLNQSPSERQFYSGRGNRRWRR